ncbi:MAG: Ig-like domain-containing protein, partial [Leptolyngbyaceae cyanobacterium MO_188.B28]|nr:Ig-like domain-containing protein [Leptolyngbyaceae cyanobacterium MO_188.B28]
MDNTEVIELIYTTVNSPTPFSLSELQVLDIDSLSTSAVRDAYAWSESGTWTPLGTGGSSSPAGSVVSVDTSTANDIGNFVLTDPDGSNDLNNLVQFTQVTAIDNTLSDVLVNMTGEINNHNVQFNFDTPQTTASLFAFNSGSSEMLWGFFPQFSVTLSPSEAPDTDNDGAPDYLDLDSDNDGISDLVESGQDASVVDTNNDGVRDDIADDPAANDTDNDGLADAVDTLDSGSGAGEVTNGTQVIPTSTDSDSVFDFLDLDSDGDSIPDTVEARLTAGYTANDGDVTDNDADGDGVIDLFDSNDGSTGDFGGTFTPPVNTDDALPNSDTTPDYLDTDSDGDSILDSAEAGAIATAPTYTDPDGSVDDPSTLPNANGAGDVDFRELPNNSPVGTTDNASTNEVTPVVIDVLANDSDSDGTLDPATVTIITAPTNGTTSINATTGEITYTPNAGFSGPETFTYTVQDNGGATSDPVTVNVDVNDTPVGTDDSDATNEVTPVVIGVLANDSDSDGTLDPATVTIATAPSNGTTSINATTGEITYTPNAGFSGPETFTYTVQDNGGATSAPVTVNIDVNDTPVGTDDSDATNEVTPVVIDVLANDSDSDGTLDPATVTIATAPTNGTTSINATTGEITYTPNAGFSGPETFTYTVQDNDGATSAPVTVNIDVNDTPV